MANTILERLGKMGVQLPEVAAPAANYQPTSMANGLVYTAGQLPLEAGALAATGLLGRDLDTEAGRKMARLCAINILAAARSELGDLERIRRIVKITVFVASAPGFSEQHLVANGASDFLAEALGERGRHARSAVGVAMLPMNAPVEIEAIIEAAE
jgi:enamine deaminase RidA (YjgF/YER057c/UK114 family)